MGTVHSEDLATGDGENNVRGRGETNQTNTGFCVMWPRRTDVTVLDHDGRVVDEYVEEIPIPKGQASSREKVSIPPDSRGPFLRLVEAAAFCRCGKSRVTEWERRGLVQSVRDPDGRRFYRKSDLAEVMSAGPQPRSPASTVARRQRRARAKDEWELPVTYPRTKARPPGRKPGGE